MNLDTARQAHRLAKDLAPRDIANRLKLGSAREARDHMAVGRVLEIRDAAAPTEAELLLLFTLASEERANLQAGSTATSKARYIAARARKGAGWCSRVGKQLVQLGLLKHSRNGHIWLTDAGWFLVQAIEQKVASRDDTIARLLRAERPAPAEARS